MSLRTQKMSRLQEHSTTWHLVFGSTRYEHRKVCMWPPGTDNCAQDDHLYIYLGGISSDVHCGQLTAANREES